MNQVANMAYIIETENYIEKHKNEMPENVYMFIKNVCADEKKYHDLIKQWSQQKGILKKPEPKLT